MISGSKKANKDDVSSQNDQNDIKNSDNFINKNSSNYTPNTSKNKTSSHNGPK
jgi:hypothetical protein